MRSKQVRIDWNDDRMSNLQRMARLGYTSYEISAAIGVSRSAVCAKCWRIGITLMGSTCKKTKPRHI